MCAVVRFLELLWLFENAASSHASERVLPTGTVELVINLGETAGSFDAVVAGPHSRFFVLDTSRPSSIIGVHFKPGGAFPFFALPVDELRNRHVPLEALWAGRTAELRERLLAAEGAGGQAPCCWSVCCCPGCSGRSPRHAAVGHALAAFRRRAGARIADVVDETGLSPRRFIGLFSDEVGLDAQVVLPHPVASSAPWRCSIACTPLDWAETALACGYCDQSHMIHDFQDFAGLSPASLSRPPVRAHKSRAAMMPGKKPTIRAVSPATRMGGSSKEACMTKPIPEGYHAITPYLIVRRGAEAIQFYARAFGAVEHEGWRVPAARSAMPRSPSAIRA